MARSCCRQLCRLVPIVRKAKVPQTRSAREPPREEFNGTEEEETSKAATHSDMVVEEEEEDGDMHEEDGDEEEGEGEEETIVEGEKLDQKKDDPQGHEEPKRGDEMDGSGEEKGTERTSAESVAQGGKPGIVGRIEWGRKMDVGRKDGAPASLGGATRSRKRGWISSKFRATIDGGDSSADIVVGMRPSHSGQGSDEAPQPKRPKKSADPPETAVHKQQPFPRRGGGGRRGGRGKWWGKKRGKK
jgi:hypothetical protein